MNLNLVVTAVVRKGDEVLLLEQQGPDDPAPSWGLPGGRVEEGELLTEALAREVREETGLEVVDPGRLLYALQHTRPQENSQTLAFVFDVAAWTGDLRVADPDNIVLRARFLPRLEAIATLEAHLPWRTMREPVVAHLRGEAPPGAVWLYRQEEFIARLNGHP